MEELIRLSQLVVLQQTDYLKAEIDALRPLSKEQEDRIMQKFRLDWNFHSNAIEGNSLDYGETVAFLMHGITAKGKPFKDYLDIKGHNEAIDFLLELIRTNDDLTEKDIRSLHQLLLIEPYEVKAETPDGCPTTKQIVPGRYKTSPNHVRTATGAVHYYATPEDTPVKMQELMNWYREAKSNPAIHPIVLAAIFHHRFVSIHPFDDGNGRMTRLLMNLMLMQAHYPPVVLKHQERGAYYLTLSQADTGDDEPFVEFIADNMIRALELYLKGAKGESLDELSDLDKELALFKKEVEGRDDFVPVKRSVETQAEVYKNSIKPLLDKFRLTLNKFKDLFFEYEESSLDETEETWISAKLDMMQQENLFDEKFKNKVERDLSYNSDKTIYVRFKLGKYKVGAKTDVHVHLCLRRPNFTYQIGYKVTEEDVPTGKFKVTDKPYHQFLSEAEISGMTNEMGYDVLNLIKQKTAK